MKKHKSISLFQALLPIFILIVMLSYNVLVYGEDSLEGSNQFILLLGAAIAACIGFYNKVPYDLMMKKISKNIRSTAIAILILLFVGALSGTWLLSGIIPSMIYYGLKLINPSIFLMTSVFICILISLSTGSSWTTTATVGLALVGIGSALGINEGMTAGAVISGAYFGDKVSPLSETTNLAPAVAGTDLFTHVRYMMYTSIPSMILCLTIFGMMGFFIDLPDVAVSNSNIQTMLAAIKDTFYVTPFLFTLPIFILVLIIKKVQPLIAILLGTLIGGVFAIFIQPDLVIYSSKLKNVSMMTFEAAYKGVINAMTLRTVIPSDNPILSKLFQSGGMSGMLNTVWLILCAMTFGGVLDVIGALKRITDELLRIFHTVFGLFASTVISCLTFNLTASDQYLAIILPGEMFAKAFKDKKLAPENLSRTLEDSATITSALVPWNTGGAYQSSVLGVSTLSYLPYAFFNIISPFMTLLFVALNIKIRKLK